ncbi:MAG: beta-propeller fold lactonase family protein, partial [Bacteroidota bacterium]
DFDATSGQLTPTETHYQLVDGAPKPGPRHFAFHPAGTFAYSINELNSTISTYRYANGKLTNLQTITTLPADYNGPNNCADIHLHPNGRFLYGSNRGHNSIAIFSINQDGTLVPSGHTATQGTVPRNFALSPDGAFLFAANQNSNNISSFKLDAESGALSFIGSTKVATPVCLAFAVPAGQMD